MTINSDFLEGNNNIINTINNKSNKKGLIFIGDIHGQYQKLDNLLSQLNFDTSDPTSAVSQYQLVFIGDLIDNIDDITIDHVTTLTRIKQLVDDGFAYCIMGNHELNAVGWATKNAAGNGHARPHSVNNRKQHNTFLHSVVEDSEQHQYWIEWFKSLPLYIDFGDIRAIHACWNEQAINNIKPYLTATMQLKNQYWAEVFDKQKPLYHLIETLLKGPELSLPEGASFLDKTGTKRTNIRISWWLGHATTYRDIAQVQDAERENIPELQLPDDFIQQFTSPSITSDAGDDRSTINTPVVIGHYTLNGQYKFLGETKNVVCVDYNAASKEGELVSFVYHRDTKLADNVNQFVSSSLKAK